MSKIDTGFSEWDETFERTVRESFDIIDDNKDGRISMKEFQSFMKMMGKGGKAKETFKILDQNKNGMLEYTEYRRYIKAVWELGQNGDIRPHLQIIFDYCDKPENGKTEKKGYLTPKEFYKFLKLADVGVGFFEKKTILKKYDENHDQVITLEEILNQQEFLLPKKEEEEQKK